MNYKTCVLRALFLTAFATQFAGLNSTLGQELDGSWKGRWTADASGKRSEHGGTLRMHLSPTGPNTYQGRFSGRFAVIVPYFYRAEVVRVGNQIQSTKRLGPFGSYSMKVCVGCEQLSGRWQAGKHAGSIRLHRR